MLRLRRGLGADRLNIVPGAGEPLFDTDTYRLYIGDASTSGGRFIGPDVPGSGLFRDGIYLGIDYSVVDTRYQQSGIGSVYTAGSGINLVGGQDFNVYGGYGLSTGLSGLSVDTSVLDVRYQASGSYQPYGNYQPSGNYQLSGDYITSSGSWEISGTSAALAATLPSLYQASGYLTEGSGLYQVGPIVHVGGGWGITVSDSGIVVKTSDLDMRYAPSGAAPSLTDLTDVTIALPISGQLVGYNGIEWVNVDVSGVVLAGGGLTQAQVLNITALRL